MRCAREAVACMRPEGDEKAKGMLHARQMIQGMHSQSRVMSSVRRRRACCQMLTYSRTSRGYHLAVT